MAAATTTKRKKRRNTRRGGLSGMPQSKNIVPILKAGAMLALGMVAGQAANSLTSNMLGAENTGKFNAKALVGPAIQIVGGMYLIDNPTAKYIGLGMTASGLLGGVNAVTGKDVLNLPALKSLGAKTGTATPPATPIASLGTVEYLEFDDDDENSEDLEGWDNDSDDTYGDDEYTSALPQSSSESIEGVDYTAAATFI